MISWNKLFLESIYHKIIWISIFPIKHPWDLDLINVFVFKKFDDCALNRPGPKFYPSLEKANGTDHTTVDLKMCLKPRIKTDIAAHGSTFL